MPDKNTVSLTSPDETVASNSIWKKFIVGNSIVGASAENETKRAMQSRHMMMIGECGLRLQLYCTGA